MIFNLCKITDDALYLSSAPTEILAFSLKKSNTCGLDLCFIQMPLKCCPSNLADCARTPRAQVRRDALQRSDTTPPFKSCQQNIRRWNRCRRVTLPPRRQTEVQRAWCSFAFLFQVQITTNN